MPIPTDEERIGTLVGGKYLLGRIIGRGGMGVIYEATHSWTARRVALKLLNPFFVQDEGVVERFLREARSAAALNHPNVVDVIDMGADDKHTVFIALELLEGESLAARLERERSIAPAQAVEILLPIMAALDVAHAGGIVHRDLKPDNIFLSVDGAGRRIPKLLDFGIAKLAAETTSGRGTKLGSVIGTPYYMSPEQAVGSADIGPASDVWSMGVVVYECVAGMLPFDGESPQAVIDAILHRSYTPLAKCRASVSEAFATAVERAITSDPAIRYAQIRQFAIALASATDQPHPWSDSRERESSIRPSNSATLAATRVDAASPEPQDFQFATTVKRESSEPQAIESKKSDSASARLLTTTVGTSRTRAKSIRVAAYASLVVAIVACAVLIASKSSRSGVVTNAPEVRPRATAPMERRLLPSAHVDRPAAHAELPPSRNEASQPNTALKQSPLARARNTRANDREAGHVPQTQPALPVATVQPVARPASTQSASRSLPDVVRDWD